MVKGKDSLDYLIREHWCIGEMKWFASSPRNEGLSGASSGIYATITAFFPAPSISQIHNVWWMIIKLRIWDKEVKT